MKADDNIRAMLPFMALMPLRALRDWSDKEGIAAFTGDPEKQSEELAKKIWEAIIELGLLEPAEPSQDQKEKWLAGLDELDGRVGLTSHLWGKGNRHEIH